MKLRTAVFFVAFVFLASALFVMPVDAADHAFVGVNKCKLCHKKPEVGEQYLIWQESAHAGAFETLGTPEALAVGAEKGVANPQESPECLRCHATAYYFTTGQVTENISPSEGVSCESCHGPGKDYMKMSVMKDRDQAIASGLIIPDEQTCLKCHNSESPTFKPFHYDERWAVIQHPIPKG